MSTTTWRVFDERSLETMPRNAEPIEMGYSNGETVQGSYEDGVFSIDPLEGNDLKDRDAQPIRFRYLEN